MCQFGSLEGDPALGRQFDQVPAAIERITKMNTNEKTQRRFNNCASSLRYGDGVDLGQELNLGCGVLRTCRPPHGTIPNPRRPQRLPPRRGRFFWQPPTEAALLLRLQTTAFNFMGNCAGLLVGYQSEPGRIRCTPRNPVYSPFELTLGDDAKIIGRVVQQVTRFL